MIQQLIRKLALLKRPSCPLVVVYSDCKQLYENCFIAQLYKVLLRNFPVMPVSLSQLGSGKVRLPPSHLGVLCLLKQRQWSRVLPDLKFFLDGASVAFYDQDPWEAYHDTASSPGIYEKVARELNVALFLVTSNFWAEHIHRVDGVPVRFVRMGVLPEYCNVAIPFERRIHKVAFQGTIHEHRRLFFDRMSRVGVDVKLLPPRPYRVFLRQLQNIQIFLHDETASLSLQGVNQDINGLWVKEIEVASQGCFAIRNADVDFDAYGVGELPTVIAYRDEREVPDIVSSIINLPSERANSLIASSVAAIRERNDWLTVVDALRFAFQ